MELDSVLKDLDLTLGTTEKQASEKPTTSSPSLADSALAAVGGANKTASAKTELPIPALQKLAAEMVGKDAVETAKVAHTIGEAMADGFAGRMALYERAAEEQQKTAMEQVDAETIKLAEFAKKDPKGFLDWVAKQAGVDDAAVKQAEAEGAQEMIDMTYKAGCDHYLAGYDVGTRMGSPAQ